MSEDSMSADLVDLVRGFLEAAGRVARVTNHPATDEACAAAERLAKEPG